MLPTTTSASKDPIEEEAEPPPLHDNDSDHRPPQKKKKLVVFKRKPNSIKLSKRPLPTSLQLLQQASRQSGNSCSTQQQQQRPRRGLPNFSNRSTTADIVVATIHQNDENNTVDDALENDDDDDALFENLACDTYLVFQSLLLNQQTRIDIPILPPSGNAKNDSIPGILECQLHERFQNGASSVSRELEELLRNNTLRCLVSTIPVSSNADTQEKQGVGTLMIVVKADDYARAIRAYNTNTSSSDIPLQQQSGIIDWFIHHLKRWTRKRSVIALRDMERAWETSKSLPPSWNVKHAIRFLQDSQFLMPASSDHESFRLWFPSWGSLVLPAFIKAQTASLAYLRQSRYKERSLTSLMRRLSTYPIPVEHVLLPWLVAQGYVERIERPAGPCIRLITD
jgi:hypothetical protein